MWQNRIEKYTDTVFTSLNKHKTHLSPSPSSSFNKKHINTSHSIPKPKQNRQIFRQGKKQMGLSKADIDKLQIMCINMSAQDYLNRLIRIHQDERINREEVEIVIGDADKEEGQRDRIRGRDRGRGRDRDRARQSQGDSEGDSEGGSSDEDEDDGQCRSQKGGLNVNMGSMKSNGIVSKKKTKRSSIFKKQQQQLLGQRSAITRAKNPNKIIKTQKKPQIQKTKSLLKPSISMIPQQTYPQRLPHKQKSKSILKQSIIKSPISQNPSLHFQSQSKPTIPLQKQNNKMGKINLGTISSFQNTYRSVQIAEPFQINNNNNKQNLRSQKVLGTGKDFGEGKGEDGEGESGNGEEDGDLQGYFEEKNVPQAKQLEELCYTEIGRRMVITRQKQIHRQFFKTNLHIRSYIMKNILSYIQCLAQYSPQSIFILPNQRAIHFDPQQKPPQLNAHLQHTKYIQIIKNVNHIIQKNIFKQKYQKSPSYPYPNTSNIFMLVMFIILFIMICLVVFTKNQQYQIKNIIMIVTGLVICVVLVWLIGYSVYCYAEKCKFVPVCQVIYRDIQNYFRFVNGKMENQLQWIVGESFFWLEVRIRKKQGIQIGNTGGNKGSNPNVSNGSIGNGLSTSRNRRRIYCQNYDDPVIEHQ